MGEKHILWLWFKWKNEWTKGTDLFPEVAVSCKRKTLPKCRAVRPALFSHASACILISCVEQYEFQYHFLIQPFYKLLKSWGCLFQGGWTAALILCMLQAGPRCFSPKCTCCGSLPEHHTTLSCIQSKGINHDFTTVHQLTYCCFVTGGRKVCCLKPCHWFSSHSSMKACHMPL